MAIPAIAAANAILQVVGALGQAIAAGPNESDEDRERRLGQLKTITQHGLSAEQEEYLRNIGLGAVRTAERETRTRRADALAGLQGGASVQDYLAAEARDNESMRKSRLAVDETILKQDERARERGIQEQERLQQQKAARLAEQTKAWSTFLPIVGESISAAITTDGLEETEGIKEKSLDEATGGAAGSMAGPVAAAGASDAEIRGVANTLVARGIPMETAMMLASLPPEEREAMIQQFLDGAN